jgi:hypothetical protein
MVMRMGFLGDKRSSIRVILLSVSLLLLSKGTLADEEASRQPVGWESRLEMLRSVPYLGFSETVVSQSDTGVVLYDPERTCDGYNLYCTWSSGEAFLLDMHGRVVHRWTYSPERERTSKQGVVSDHAIMLENGDLVVIKKFEELLKLNWDSQLIWGNTLAAHHDVASAPDGSLYAIVLEKKEHRGTTVRFDAMVHLTETGEEIDRWSAYDRLAEIKSLLDTRSFLDTVIDGVRGGGGRRVRRPTEVAEETGQRLRDLTYFNMNTVNVLPATILGERDGRFQRGNLLICLRNVNQVAVLEKDTYRVLWAWGEGELEWPHHPTMLENGHILIFDNGVKRRYSRVVELDPVAGAIVWEYKAEPPEDFFSRTRGSAQRLPNGNTLICESDKGRAFEVTDGGEVVWLWVNPATRQEHPETIYRMMRLPLNKVEALLKR